MVESNNTKKQITDISCTLILPSVVSKWQTCKTIAFTFKQFTGIGFQIIF